MFKIVTTLSILFGSIAISNTVIANEWSGYAGLEFRGFSQTAQESRQDHSTNFSFVFEPEYYHEWDEGNQSIAFVPFVRLDENDNERTHFDIRELTYLKVAESWELRLGVRKVFWGVTEFQHLVDVINQTDLVENLDTEDKLGQPMINLALINDWGTVDLFVMPYFRERYFPGTSSRLRTIPHIDQSRSQFESAAKEKHVDFAARYSHYFGDWDIGVSHFYGTSRDPRLLLSTDNSGNAVFIPFYDIINQTSLDLQATKGNMLWKLEALHRSGQATTYNAIAAGFEYTFVGIMDSAIDLGLLSEYHYDDRGESASSTFEDDIAVGARLAFNDAQSSEALIGLVWDRNTGGKFFNIEASRRLSDSFLLEAQGRFFTNQKNSDPAKAFAKDDYIELFLSYNF
ncbi:MAG: hypothetical protein HND53_09745 [Proteobacteria bacterium]|nr:hypothetical protein [Pseudomonadota bacterium]NOG60770.1 hypothetical protein [Pseudomonadota bacterium]